MLTIEDVVCLMSRWTDAVNDESVTGSEVEEHSDFRGEGLALGHLTQAADREAVQMSSDRAL